MPSYRANRATRKPTLLFGAVNLDLIEIDEDLETSGIDNFNYLITSQSYRQDLETFYSLFAFERIGVLIDEPLAEILQIEDVFNAITDELGADYTLIPYSGISDLEPYLDDIDAVYLAEGFSLSPDQIEALANLLLEREIPSFTATPKEDVTRGLMATNQAENNLNLFLRRIALNVESVVNGANFSELPLLLEVNPALTVNWNTAEKVGVPIKYSRIATTEFVGDFENVNSEKTYSLLDVIDEMLGANLLLALTQKDVELAGQNLQSARSNYLPDVSAGASGTYLNKEAAEFANGANPEYSTSGNITLSQTLFSEAANANISIQKSLLEAEKENLNTTELDLILNAANAYFNILILKSNLEIQSENLSVTRQNLQIAEQNFEAGQSGRADVLRFSSQVAQNMQSLIEAGNQLEEGFYTLNEILNQPIDREIDVEDAALNAGIFEAYNYEDLREFIDSPTTRKAFCRFSRTRSPQQCARITRDRL